MTEPVKNITYHHILGHSRPISVLKAAVNNNRVAHAYLFSGPDGVGKRTTAMAFAAALNCLENSDSPCGACLSCKKILQENHPDVYTVLRDGNFIKIEQIREIGKRLNYKPHEGRVRVHIIPQAHRMNLNAANALLKTLEEPRPNNLLILITSNPQQLLPTILSRCQQVNFGNLQNDEIEKLVLDQMDCDRDTASLLARLSKGSVGWIMRSDLDEIVEKRREVLFALADLDFNDELEIATFGEKLIEADRDMEKTLELIKTFLRDAVILYGKGCRSHLINIDMEDQIQLFSSRFAPARLLSMGRSVGYAQRLLMRNVNKNLIATSLALELVHPFGAGFDEKRMPR